VTMLWVNKTFWLPKNIIEKLEVRYNLGNICVLLVPIFF
jgi:hypothetical protein